MNRLFNKISSTKDITEVPNIFTKGLVFLFLSITITLI